jgi:conjugal transfer pilus assembly protein TraD
VFKQRFDETANMLAKTLGTIIGKKNTYQIEDGSRGSRGSEREVNEFICHPDIIKNLKRGQCVLLQHDPTRVDLINVRNRRAEFIPTQVINGNTKEVKTESVENKISSPVGEKIMNKENV